MFTPMSNVATPSVKCESSTAAGTLLMTWLVKADASSPHCPMTGWSICARAGIRAMFPAKTKKQRNVASNG